MPYNPNIHHRRSIRLHGYDYRSAGAYFITICTFDRACTLKQRDIISAVQTAWRRAVCEGKHPEPYEFVVMPNHIHGIVWLSGDHAMNTVGARHPSQPTSAARTKSFDDPRTADPGRASPPPAIRRLTAPPPPPVAGSLSAIIGAFKSAATKRINALRDTPKTPVWQDGFFDRIVRNDRELYAIRQYILDNPAKWEEDKHNPQNWPPRS